MRNSNLFLVFTLFAILAVAFCQQRTTKELIQEGYNNIAQGRFEGTVKLFEKAVEQSPDDYDALVGLGIARWRTWGGDHLRAMEAFIKALNVQPQNPVAITHAADLCMEADIKDVAENFYRSLVDRHLVNDIPKQAVTKVKLGRLILEAHPEEALTLLKSALPHLPSEEDQSQPDESLLLSSYSANLQMSSRFHYTQQMVHNDIAYATLLSQDFKNAVQNFTRTQCHAASFGSMAHQYPSSDVSYPDVTRTAQIQTGANADSSVWEWRLPLYSSYGSWSEKVSEGTLQELEARVALFSPRDATTNGRVLSQPDFASLRSKSRDVVAGLASGLKPLWIHLFVTSLRVHSNARVVLFMDEATLSHSQEWAGGSSEFMRRLVMYYDVDIVPFNVTRDLTEYPEFNQTSPTAWRFPLILQWLERHRAEMDRVLLMDVRDTAFQSDPFHAFVHASFPTSHPDMVFMEEWTGVTLDTCKWNAQRFTECFGQDVLNTFGSEYILNSGTFAGRTASMIEFLEAHTSHLGKCARTFAGHDQAVLNYLVRERTRQESGSSPSSMPRPTLPNAMTLAVLRNADGPVLTIGHELTRKSIITHDGSFRRIDTLGRLLNENMLVPAIIHQYDRHPRLVSQLRKSHPFMLSLLELFFSPRGCVLQAQAQAQMRTL